MSNFAQLFEESLNDKPMYVGALVTGKVIDITSDYVIVNAGYKSESVVPIEQFKLPNGNLEVAIGDDIEMVLEAFENGNGETKLSREKAKRVHEWKVLEKAHEGETIVYGYISGKVRGGFTVDLNGIRAFLPGSLVDVRPVRDIGYLEGKELELKVIKIDAKRNNVVVSRRAVVESENSSERTQLLDDLEEGHEVKGVVKNLTDYGAFVDLGGVDGLLHITDMAWKRVKHPSEIVEIGDEIKVKVLKLDREKFRVSLGIKQLGADPWEDLVRRYPEGSRLNGKVTNITDYGCFVELEEGIEGLVHVSEMDWTNKNIHPSKVVHLGQEVNVVVLDIDADRRRISLGVKQCNDNPWNSFASNHEKGDHITGKIKSITDFGIFIGLEGNIDGLVHLSDVSWEEDGDDAIRQFKKGEDLETIILGIDADRERISLGVKQLNSDPFNEYVSVNPKGGIVVGKVLEVEAEGAVVELAPNVFGYIEASEVDRKKVLDVREAIKVGADIETKIVTIDRKNRTVGLSIKAKQAHDDAVALKDYSEGSSEGVASTSLGDLLKEQIGKHSEKVKKDDDTSEK
jgi:small subunit ribosomal protein S1